MVYNGLHLLTLKSTSKYFVPLGKFNLALNPSCSVCTMHKHPHWKKKTIWRQRHRERERETETVRDRARTQETRTCTQIAAQPLAESTSSKVSEKVCINQQSTSNIPEICKGLNLHTSRITCILTLYMHTCIIITHTFATLVSLYDGVYPGKGHWS